MSDPIWVRSVKYHSYHNVLQEPGTFYFIDNEADLETVMAHKLAVREPAPRRAERPVLTTEAQVPVTADAAHVEAAAPEPVSTEPIQTPRRGRPVRPMSAGDFKK